MKNALTYAYRYLRDLIAQGWEYPDAHAKAVTRYGVDGDALAAAYDREVPVWPLYGSAAEARCFNCAAELANTTTHSGNAPGHGQFSAYCSACDLRTFFDLTNGS